MNQKKYMTALTEEDLDVVFDTFTKEKQCRIFLTHILLKGRMLSQLLLLKKHRNQKKTQLLKCKKKAVVEKEKTAVKPAVKESKSNAANKK